MNELLQDIAFAWRNAIRTPGAVLLIVLTLALGVGANTAVFSVIWHVLLAPLPYEGGERLVRLEQKGLQAGIPERWWSVPTFGDVQEQSTVFADLLEYERLTYTLLGPGDAELVSAGVVNWRYFEALGIRTVLGRTFVPDDDLPGARPVMLLSQDYWVSRFGGSEEALGAAVEMNGVVYTVAGVLGGMIPYPHANDVWIPAATDFIRGNDHTVNNRQARWAAFVIGKLREGVTPEDAHHDLDTVAKRLSAAHPDVYGEDYTITAKPLRDDLAGSAGATFSLLLGLAFVILLIVSANVANINLARMAGRTRELAVREAVGASPHRIRRQLLTENLLSALGGGLGGVVIAHAGVGLLRDFASLHTPLAAGISLDLPMLVFALGATVLAILLSGAAARPGRVLTAALKEGGDRASASKEGKRRRQALLLAQFALALATLSITAGIVLSLQRLERQDAGYSTDQILAVSTEINYALLTLGDEYTGELPLRLLERVATLPGVESAALHAGNPLLRPSLYGFQPEALEIEGRDGPAPAVSAVVNLATEEFFDLMGIPLLQGRAFAARDDAQAPAVAVVNQAFARRWFPSGDAVGATIRHGTKRAAIVGVVGTIRPDDLEREEGPTVYFNYRQSPSSVINLYVRSARGHAELESDIRALFQAVDPRQAVGTIQSLENVKTNLLAPQILRAVLIGLSGFLALFVTLSGVIGAVSCDVSQQTREIGMLMAVGANPQDIMLLLFVRYLRIYVPGILAGLGALWLAAPFIQPFLYQTRVMDPAILLASIALLTLAVAASVYLPARRASALSPARALHRD